MRRASRARLAKRPAPRDRPVVSDVMSSSWCASSITTTSCSGRMAPPDPTSRPYRWVLTTTRSAASARRRALSAKHGSPSGQRVAPGHSSLVTLTEAQARSLGFQSSSARSPVDVVAAHVDSRSTSLRDDRRQVLQLQLAGARVPCLPHPLEAEVVAPALQDGPAELHAEVLGDERQVVGGQLVLQGLGRRGDDRGAAREDGRDQVGQRLAGAGPRLDDEVVSLVDRPRRGLGHVGLAGTGLAPRKGGGDPRQRPHGVVGRPSRRMPAVLALVHPSPHPAQATRGVYQGPGPAGGPAPSSGRRVTSLRGSCHRGSRR